MASAEGAAATVDSTLVRQINRSRIFHALLENPGSSQKELAEATGLTPGTVSNVVRELRGQGVVSGRRRSRQAGEQGRPEVSLRISDRAGLFAGVQLDMHFITLVLTSLGGRVLAHRQLRSRAELDGAVATAVTGLKQLVTDQQRDDRDLQSVGVGVTGLVDLRGHLIAAPYQDWEWRDVELADLFRASLDVPVHVDNDDKVVAMGERLFGAARGLDTFVVFNGYAGIGGGVYYQGSVLRGRSNLAGEIGHIKVVPQGRHCGCGGRGCLSAYASVTSILRILAERGVDIADTDELARRATDGEGAVLEVLSDAGRHLGKVAAMLINTLSPEAVIISGELSKLAPHLLPTLESVMREEALGSMVSDGQLRVSPLGELAVPLGGVALALDGYLGLPGWVSAGHVAPRAV